MLQSGNVELTLHGLYHETDGTFDDFDTRSKQQEKEEIQKGLDILLDSSLTIKPIAKYVLFLL